MKEQTNTWNKSCKESAKRESELYKMVEPADIEERQEHKERRHDQGLAGSASKEGKRRMNLGGSLKRWNAILTKPRPEVTKWNGSWTEYSGKT